jgi:zinc transport system permease protein
MMGIGEIILYLVAPIMESLAPIVPGEIFPYFFEWEIFQRALISVILVTVVAGMLGVFLIIQNLSLIGDGLAHVSFGGIAIALVLGATSPMWWALLFSVIASIIIYEFQTREILTGDASIAIFLTGMLALGLVTLRLGGGAVTADIEGYLFGSVLLVDTTDLNMIATICVVAMIAMATIGPSVLACTVDPMAARVQGLPVNAIGRLFSIITAAVVVSMVQVIGALLVTALLVTPAATAQQIGTSFRSCLLWTQFFGLLAVFGGLFLSSEVGGGSGAMIALFAAVMFALVTISKVAMNRFSSVN